MATGRAQSPTEVHTVTGEADTETLDKTGDNQYEVLYDRLAPVSSPNYPLTDEKGFKVEDWDPVANIPTVHFSFLLNLLLPRNLTSIHSERIQKDIAHHKRATAQYDMGAILVGSSAEGYKLPHVIKRSVFSIPFGEQTADFDTLIVWKINPVAELDKTANTKQKLVLETEATRPGYARICINDPTSVMQNVDSSFAIQVNDKFYLSAKKQRDSLLQINIQNKLNKDLLVDMQGPAVGTENILSRTLKLLRQHSEIVDRQEQVAALPCKWPNIASHWVKRKRDNDWLNSSLIETIVANGCHVVPVSHKFSENPDIEWRISFATSEVKIAQTIVTEEQRQCYICLKLLRKQLKEVSKVLALTSYHCKTVFLHACEQIPVAAWKENTGVCLLHLLDNLITCFRNKNLPSFFITGNNLISHYTNEEISETINVLQKTRTDPITPILDYCDDRIITGHGVKSNFRNIVDCILRDFKAYQIHRNLTMTVPEFFAAHIMAINGLLLDNNVHQVAVNLLDNWDFLERMVEDMDVSDFAVFTLSRWKLVMQLIQVVEAILKHLSKPSSLTKLRNYQACLYHAASYNFTPGSTANIAALQRSIDMFTKCPEASVDMAILHYKMGDINRAKDVLRVILSSQVAHTPEKSQYSVTTLVTLDEHLRNEAHKIVLSSGLVSIPTEALLRYMLLKCLQQDKTNLSEEIELFENYCKGSSNAWPDFLLGLVMMSVQEFDRAHTLFSSCGGKGGNLLHEQLIHVSKVMDFISLSQMSDALKYFRELSPEGKLKLHVVNTIALSLTKASYAASLMEEVMDYPGFLYGNLACMYHASAYEYTEDSEEQELALAQADTLFATCTNEENVKLSTVVDYAMFLSKQQRWEECTDLLSAKLPSNRQCSFRNGYGIIEYHTLDDNLKKEIDIHGSFDTISSCMAYYLLAKSIYVSSKNLYDKIISEFCSNVSGKKDSRGFALLGYAYMLDQRWRDAEHYFCKAVEISWDYTAAKQNAIECRRKAQEKGFPKRDLRKLYIPLAIIPDIEGDYTLDYDKITL